MEIQARELLERQSERTGEFPQMQQRLRHHLRETEQQLRGSEIACASVGETESTMKDTALSALANITAMAHAMAGDEILKNTFADNAFENYEIAAYKSLLALCNRAGVDLSGPLTTSLREEEEMAEIMAAWIDSNVEARAAA